jgi:hypothetical protein
LGIIANKQKAGGRKAKIFRLFLPAVYRLLLTIIYLGPGLEIKFLLIVPGVNKI